MAIKRSEIINHLNLDKPTLAGLDAEVCHVLGNFDLKGVWEHYTKHGITSLRAELDFNIKRNELPSFMSSLECEHCVSQLIGSPGDAVYKKGEFHLNLEKGHLFCPVCKHIPMEESNCSCSQCKEATKKRQNILKEQILKEKATRDKEKQEQALEFRDFLAGYGYRTIAFDDITIRDKIYLLTLIRGYTDEGMETIGPMLRFSGFKIAPKGAMTEEIINGLRLNHVITFDFENIDPDAYILHEDGNFQYYPGLVTYCPRVRLDNSDHDTFTIRELSMKLEKWAQENDFEDDTDELLELWKELALAECLEYLDLLLSERNLPYNVGIKTIDAIKNALSGCSVALLYAFLSSSVTRVSDYYQKGGISKKQAVNIIPGKINAYFDKYNSGGWTGNGYRRNFNCPQSILSEVIFNKVLKIGVVGFEESYSDYDARTHRNINEFV